MPLWWPTSSASWTALLSRFDFSRDCGDQPHGGMELVQLCPLPLHRLEGAVIEGGRIVGQDHLKFQAVGRSRAIPVFGPHLGKHLGRLRGDMRIVGHLRADTYRGGRNIEFVLKDMR